MKRKESRVVVFTHCAIKLLVTVCFLVYSGYFLGVCEFNVVKKRSSILEDVGNVVDGGVGLVKRGYELIK